MRPRPDAARGLAVLLTTAGLNHFLMPRFYDAMIPPQLPGSPRAWTYGSGLAEIAVGAAVAVPASRRTGGRLAAWLFVAVLPGNIQMVVDSFRRARPWPERLVLLVRLPVQLPLIVWALRVYRARTPGTIAA